MEVLNPKLVLGDSVKVKLVNNTDENYLFYIHTPRLSFSNRSDVTNKMNAQITLNNHPVSILLSSDPFVIPNEDGGFDKWDIDLIAEVPAEAETKTVLSTKNKPSSETIIFFKKAFVSNYVLGRTILHI